MADNPAPLEVSLSIPSLVAGAPFSFAPTTPPGWYDQGDDSGQHYWRTPGIQEDGSFYVQPGTYLLEFHAYDGRAAELVVPVRGAPAFTTDGKRVVLGTQDLRQLGFSGSDNGVHSCRGRDWERLYFFAHPDSEDGWQTWDSYIVRISVPDGVGLRDGAVHRAKIHNHPLKGRGYLDAGPVIRYGDRLWMLALAGWNTSAATHGSIELLYSDDWGDSWTWASNAVTQPFTVEQHEASGPDNDANMAVGAVLVADADGDGRDYIYCYFHQAEEGGRINSLGVARADIHQLDAAVNSGQPRPWLWQKRLDGDWVGRHDGPADELLQCGGWPSVVWCAPLQRYLLLTAAPTGTDKSLFYLSSSQYSVGPWSEPALVYAEQQPGWFASVPTFDAPDGYVGLDFDVLLGPCWFGSIDGSEVATAHEVHGVRVSMAK